MDWFINIFTQQTFTQAILIISMICAIGIGIGNIKFFGISFGVIIVFFAGILAGHFGLAVNQDMLNIFQNFGLILFIYSLGVQVGPGFFSSFKHGGMKFNLLSFLLLVTGSAMAIIIHLCTDISIGNTVGLLCGAVTNTPMLGAAQQTLLQINPEDIEGVNNMATACAVGYPCGLIGMILCVIFLRMTMGKKIKERHDPSSDNTFIAEYHVSNPAIFGKTVQEIRHYADCQFVISRIWKNGKVMIPTSESIIEENEHLLVISSKNDVDRVKTLFGEKEDIDWNKKDIDWNAIDSQLVSKIVLVTKPELNGIKLGDLKLRNSYGINITRVNRAGIDILPNRSLRLQLGDKLTIVGEARAIENVKTILGNQAKELNNPNLFTIFVGIVLGLILGSIPIAFPGMNMPIMLGIAGGPMITGLLMGAFGPRLHLSIYMSRSANLMLRQLGLTIYLAGLGLSAGAGFFETVFSSEGLKWVAISFSLATVPVLIVAFIASKFFKTEYADNVGMLCGSMANPFALDFADPKGEGEDPAVAYATVYPAGIFLRVISAQIILLLFI